MKRSVFERPFARAYRCGVVAIVLAGLSACTIDTRPLSDIRGEINSSSTIPYSGDTYSDLASASAGAAVVDYPTSPMASDGGTPQQTVGEVTAIELIKTLGVLIRGAATIAVFDASGSSASSPIVGNNYDPFFD